MYFTEDNNYFEFNDYNNEYNDIDFKINNFNFNRNDNNLYKVEEGFNRGNMFKDTYSKYKNHVYKLKVNTDKDKLLYSLQAYTFALKDLNLYLDIYPNDKNILSLYNEYSKTLESLKNKYIKMYGPLCTSDVKNLDKWTWISNPWPWDKGGNK